MRKPTQIEAFRALYSIAAADGRGEALFGDSFDQALDFYERALKGWGLADDRWREIAGTAFAHSVGVEREDGAEERFALIIRFNYAKVKFSSCELKPAKFYLTCAAGPLR